MHNHMEEMSLCIVKRIKDRLEKLETSLLSVYPNTTWSYQRRVACPPGMQPDRYLILCSSCLPGTYKSFNGLYACIPCPKGFQQKQPGSTTCRLCPKHSSCYQRWTIKSKRSLLDVFELGHIIKVNSTVIKKRQSITYKIDTDNNRNFQGQESLKSGEESTTNVFKSLIWFFKSTKNTCPRDYPTYSFKIKHLFLEKCKNIFQMDEINEKKIYIDSSCLESNSTYVLISAKLARLSKRVERSCHVTNEDECVMKLELNHLDDVHRLCLRPVFQNFFSNLTSLKFFKGIDRIQVECQPGRQYNSSLYKCEECPKGTYKGEEDEICLHCPIGKYQNKIGQTECLECESRKTKNLRRGSTNKHDCEDSTKGQTNKISANNKIDKNDDNKFNIDEMEHDQKFTDGFLTSGKVDNKFLWNIIAGCLMSAIFFFYFLCRSYLKRIKVQDINLEKEAILQKITSDRNKRIKENNDGLRPNMAMGLLEGAP